MDPLVENALCELEGLPHTRLNPSEMLKRHEASAKHVKTIRDALGLSVGQFAAKLGTQPITVIRWESARYAPSRETIGVMRNLMEGRITPKENTDGYRIEVIICAGDDAMVAIELIGLIKEQVANHASKPKIVSASLK